MRKEDLRWDEGDRSFVLGNLRFVTVHGGGGFGDWAPGVNCLLFYKTRALVEQYLDWFATLARPPRGGNLVELGLFDGGSVPFWFEVLEPERHVGVDLRPPSASRYLEDYLGREDRRGHIGLHWGIDQSDEKRVAAICDASFGDEPIDLVIDDASHRYEQTRRSFETLFPRLRPGSGLYVIEDWAWSHWKDPAHEADFRGCRPLTDLVTQLIELMGSTSSRIVADLHVRSGFAAVRRGWEPASAFGDFSVERSIYRHARPRWFEKR
jgi:hypothetical protein